MQIDWINFTPIQSLFGGIILGLSSVLMLILFGRILGISGILGNALDRPKNDTLWRIIFLIGLISSSAIFIPFIDDTKLLPEQQNLWALIVGGLLVGYGTRLGSGCTSGHGICGISRLSPRSVLATVIFMFSAIATVTITQFIF